MIVEDAAGPVIGILARANIGHDRQFGRGILQRADGLLDDTIGRVVLDADRILLCGQPKQDDPRNLELYQLGRERRQPVHGPLELAGHRGDRTPFVFAMAYKNRIDQVVDVQGRLAYQPPERRCAPQAAWAESWKSTHTVRSVSTADGRSA